MTAVSTEMGISFPGGGFQITSAGTDFIMDATAEKAALIGFLHIEGRATGKVLSAAGGGSISFYPGSVTWAAVGPATTLEVGIQDVSTAAYPSQPDGTFDVVGLLTSGVDTLTSSTWKTVAMTTGTKTMSHGDKIAIVADMTARNGADSVRWKSNTSTRGFPCGNSYLAGAWGTGSQSFVPLAYITFDDGTLGTIFGEMAPTFALYSSEAFQDSTNPDERGIIFQVPWDVKTDAVRVPVNITAATQDFTIKLYSDPLGTPTLLDSSVVPAEIYGANRTSITALFAAPISLTKNTDYCLTVLATGTGNVTLDTWVLPTTNLRRFFSNGPNIRKATRNNSAGVFTEESPAVTIYNMQILLSEFIDSAGGGLITHSGMTGGMRG